MTDPAPTPSPLTPRSTPRKKRGRHTRRVSRHSWRIAVFLGGAAVVALFSLGFAWLAETMLHFNREITHAHWWSALLMLPIAFAAIRWLTLRHAPEARGSGIPQVIAAMSMPAGKAQTTLVSLKQSLWKIVLTAAGLLAGASIGREGPSVQVGAAAMLAWGNWWQKRRRFAVGFRPDALIAAGAAGGLAAAFNTPLAGVVFAIEELGRGSVVRWDRLVIAAVLSAGFIALALVGNNPYFHIDEAMLTAHGSWQAVLLCAVLNGVLGGLFAKALLAGPMVWLPSVARGWAQRHPVWLAALCGLLVAFLGLLTAGATYGTGYEQSAALLNGQPLESMLFGLAKLGATILSYFAGIPGGIFTPSLAIGTGIGDNIAALLPGAADGRLIVLLSMAGFLAAATQSPITAAVIVMEMTRSQDVTLLLLATTLLASFISRQFCPKPFYHAAARNFRRDAMQKHQALTTQLSGQANALSEKTEKPKA
ncbi:MAG: chloride channel protein [Oxalicibacterium faecigallinarum]|uniref:chloride channel protein n=1 Tax=Oxalicibacterium faecigallinarum TaxID=573741 RepID=UPI00280936CF|nr:chloride channel protein [Oxalicibacterium faecigallinarum]MDQ7968088.1 chloride channel protein [Oxalicibacterium faecigallinarum]